MPEFENGSLQMTLDFAFKRAAMLSFMFRAAKTYRSFSFENLASFFALERVQVKKIVSKLILQNRMQASIDIKSDLLLLDSKGQDIQELQQLSLQYVSQITQMVSQNERIVDILNHQQELAGRQVRRDQQRADQVAAQVTNQAA